MSNAQALVEQALAEGKLDDLAASLDAAELQAPFAAGDPLLPPWPAAAHLLAHAGNASSSSSSPSSSSSSSSPSSSSSGRTSLDDARFLWRRLPEASREQPAAAAAFALLRALWLPDPVAAWGVLRSGFGVGYGGGGYGGGGYGGGGGNTNDPALRALAERVASGLRSRVAAVLPRAYSRLPLPRAAALLGFSSSSSSDGGSSEREAAAAFEAFVAGQAGWAVSDDGGALSLPRPAVAAAAAASAPGAASASAASAAAAALASFEDELAKLSKYILQLEAGA